MFLNKVVLRGSILKIFQDIATFHTQKYLFDLLFSEKIVPTFTFSKAVFRKKGSDADGDSLFRKRLMLKENQYSKDCRTYESIINIYYIQHLERSPYKLIDKWIV